MSKRFDLVIPDRFARTFESLARQTDLSQAELMRRMWDYCFQPHVLNQLIPCLSGRLVVGSIK